MNLVVSSVVRAVTAVCVVPTVAQAQMRAATVTVTNVAAANSISFAPMQLGFHSGAFDTFNIRATAGPGIVSAADDGAGVPWKADCAATDLTANRGVIAMALLPRQSRSQSFLVNAGQNRFFSFASMVIPSRDFFIGNDDPTP